MMKKILTLIFGVFICLASSQTVKKLDKKGDGASRLPNTIGLKLDSVFCDCERARSIVVIENTFVRYTMAPLGSGRKDEIAESKQHSVYAFETEHNSAWYKLTIVKDGNLGFDIKPVKVDDDYDFMLFKAEDSS